MVGSHALHLGTAQVEARSGTGAAATGDHLVDVVEVVEGAAPGLRQRAAVGNPTRTARARNLAPGPAVTPP
ncbi:MAG: hypothetical protein AVDCRST_MAG06-1747 [uncultured Nocardioides sp.]|uniref:Uncharacterized protein n=1 Tax=uncultured Nocardioides sp. TaxID=198441 RepID=A0A6J4NVF8_9ACTN|nr:MAG: hypothetical protein AVDCRST_MAG06-1747 [uncultured Nocardioides sp.]